MSDKLTDLEVCQRIAEIEGKSYWTHGTGEGVFINYIEGDRDSKVLYYNPLTDDALCFNLMIKYGIRYDGRKIKGKHHFWFGNIKNKKYIVNFHPNRAICLAIIESKAKSND
jgi:hypothetical protein